MRHYDYKKARDIIKENKDKLKEASLGMSEDWFWTAETIWENGKYIRRLTKNTEISGIDGSRWATPTLELWYKDGSSEMIPCYTGEKSGMRPFFI